LLLEKSFLLGLSLCFKCRLFGFLCLLLFSLAPGRLFCLRLFDLLQLRKQFIVAQHIVALVDNLFEV
jgi:hypothetical protein